MVSLWKNEAFHGKVMGNIRRNMGKSTINDVFHGKIIYKLVIFQQSMFDYQKFTTIYIHNSPVIYEFAMKTMAFLVGILGGEIRNPKKIQVTSRLGPWQNLFVLSHISAVSSVSCAGLT
jgi:hypothetical protein